MAGKARLFGDAEAERRVLAGGHPTRAKTAGRTYAASTRRSWERERFALVVEGSRRQVRRGTPRCGTLLLATGDPCARRGQPAATGSGASGSRADDESRRPRRRGAA